jgi:hypothetical protein
MIGGRGAAGEKKFRHGERHAEVERLRCQPGPDRIKRRQPGKQFAVERRRHRAGQRLIEMMMGVDQARQHDMFAGSEIRDLGRLRHAARRHQLNDTAALHHHAAFGAVGENGERVLDPERLGVLLLAHRFSCRDRSNSSTA